LTFSPVSLSRKLHYFTGEFAAAVPRVVLAGLVFVLVISGFVVIGPNESRVIQFFGRYVGSVNRAGFHWVTPLTAKRKVSLRVRNFETTRLKVSDADGNPVEIAAVVVYRVTDSAKALFAVDQYVQYVTVQAETAVRHLATSYPYEAHDTGRPSLRDSAVVSVELTAELRDRVASSPWSTSTRSARPRWCPICS
jgi:regulator of protease activity HflC (stomatin/prohibitin superfamily)